MDNPPEEDGHKFLIKYKDQSIYQPSKRYSSKIEYEAIKKHQRSQQLTKIKSRPKISIDKAFNSEKRRPTSIVSIKHDPSQKPIEKQPQNQKQYSKIPIQYFDERDHGCGAEGIRGRIVYRGYAPKNTYFFLKTLKPIKLNKKAENASRSEFELRFNSKFQSGNLSVALRVSPSEYWIFMREDTNTHGLRQWFYFQVSNRKATKIKFRIYKFSKYYSLYRMGMKPFIRKINEQWHQGGENINYDYDSAQKAYYLQFQYTWNEENEIIEIATLPPYTYTHLNSFLTTIKQHPNVTIENVGQSLSGLDIPLIKISNKKNQALKEAIFIMGRTHPGETVSSFSIQSFIERVLSLDQLLRYFDIYIVPMVNPDGVYFGNHRTCVLGQDLNRNFHKPDPQYFPQISIVQNLILKIKKTQTIRFLIDLHGHSARKNIFAYADEFQIHSKNFLLSRILPKLLNDSISSFRYDHCIFRTCKQKKNTARVFFSSNFKINAITFQQSYGLLDVGCIGILNWKNFGKALAQCLLDFAKIYENGQESALEDYLLEQTQIEKESIKKRVEKHKRLLQVDSIPEIKKKDLFILKTIQKQPTKQQQKVSKKSIEKNKDDSSIASSELESGDDELQLLDDQLQNLKKDIIKVGCLKDGIKRQKYNVADKKLQFHLWQYKQQVRLAQQKSAFIPKMLKAQIEKKQQYCLSFKKDIENYLRKVSFPHIHK